jgi:hypothetical protein
MIESLLQSKRKQVRAQKSGSLNLVAPSDLMEQVLPVATFANSTRGTAVRVSVEQFK